MTPKISVIVPVYNTGEILRNTIDSILQQTFRNFELILVDDGSTDVSKKICDEYKKKDSRIIVVHQTNRGICAARNIGIGMAKGEYITFCDHDDLYAPNKLQRQYEIAFETGADVVNVGYITKCDNGKIKENSIELRCNSKKDIRENFFDLTYCSMSTIWVKLYKMSTLKPYLKFDTKYVRGHEDVNFNLLLLPIMNSFVSSREILYTHIVRKELSTSANSHIEVIQGMKDEIKNYCNALYHYDINIVENHDSFVLKISALLRSLSVYMGKCKINRKQFIETLFSVKYPKCNISMKDVLFSNKVSFKDKLVCYLVENQLYAFLYFMVIVFLKYQKSKEMAISVINSKVIL